MSTVVVVATVVFFPLSGQKSEGEGRLGGMSGPSRRFDGGFDLRQRQARMIEKGSPESVSSTPRALRVKQLRADLVFEVPDLAAQRRLRRVQPFLGRDREASRLRDRDEIAKVP